MASLRFLPFALVLTACPGSSDDEGGSTASTDPTSSSSTTAPTTSTTAATSESSSSAGTTTTGAESSGTSESTTDPSDTADSSSTGGGVCDPHGGDNACVECTRTSCCGQLMACEGNEGCACTFDCLAGINAPTVPEQMDCAETCRADFTMVSAFLQQVYACRMGACAGDCV